MRFTLCAAAFYLLPFAAFAQTIPALRLVPAVDAQGRGETLVAEAGSVLHLYGNPAALAGIDAQVVVSYRRWIENSGFYALGAATPVGAHGRAGVLITGFDAPSLAPFRFEAEGTGFDVRFLNFAGTYAYGHRALRIGGTVKYVLQRNEIGESAHGAAVDAGVQADLLEGVLRGGVSVQHIGTIGELSGQTLQLPAALRVGFSAEPLRVIAADGLGPIARVLLAAEVVAELAETETEAGPQTRWQVGAEAEAFDLLVGRVGYLFRDAARGFTLGLGLRTGAFAFDFAYQPFEGQVAGAGQGVALRYTL